MMSRRSSQDRGVHEAVDGRQRRRGREHLSHWPKAWLAVISIERRSWRVPIVDNAVSAWWCSGIDGVTAADYAQNLEANLLDLLERIKSGRYHAPHGGQRAS
jgi:hypothetical protein